MSDNHIPYLCGGTFFTLLEQVKERNKTKQELWEGEKSSTSNKYILGGLIGFLYPSFKVPDGKNTFDTEVSEYKKCATAKGSYLPFNQDNTDTLIDDFNKRIQEKFPGELKNADHFVSRFLKHDSEALIKWLVKALLTLLEQDRPLPSDIDEFYANPDGKPVSKKDLLSQDDYCVSTLLFGIWHFIIVNRSDNETGAETIGQWCKLDEKSEKGAHLKFVSDIGKTYDRDIRIKSRSYDPYFGEKDADTGSISRQEDDSLDMIPEEEVTNENHQDEYDTDGDFGFDGSAAEAESYYEERKDGSLIQKLFINKGNGIQADTINGNITLNIGRKDGK